MCSYEDRFRAFELFIRPGKRGRATIRLISAEVCDLSESMRAVQEHGTIHVLARLEGCLRQGISGGELTRCTNSAEVAEER